MHLAINMGLRTTLPCGREIPGRLSGIIMWPAARGRWQLGSDEREDDRERGRIREPEHAESCKVKGGGGRERGRGEGGRTDGPEGQCRGGYLSRHPTGIVSAPIGIGCSSGQVQPALIETDEMADAGKLTTCMRVCHIDQRPGTADLDALGGSGTSGDAGELPRL